MKCTVKVSHRDIEKFREIQKLRKQVESFQKSSNGFEIFNSKEPIVEIATSKHFYHYSDEKDLEQVRQCALADMGMELMKYIIKNDLWEIKEYSEEPNYLRLQAILKVAINKTGD